MWSTSVACSVQRSPVSALTWQHWYLSRANTAARRRRQSLGKRSRRFEPAQPMAPSIFSQPYSSSSANNAEARGFAASVRPLRLLRLLRPPPLLLPELFLKPGNLLPAQRPGIRLLTPSASNRPLQHTGTSRCLPRRKSARRLWARCRASRERHQRRYNRQHAAHPQLGSLRAILIAGPQRQTAEGRSLTPPTIDSRSPRSCARS